MAQNMDQYRVGDRILVKDGEYMYAAKIFRIDDDEKWVKTFHVTYPGWPASHNEWMSLDQAKEKLFPFDQELLRDAVEKRKKALKESKNEKKTQKRKRGRSINPLSIKAKEDESSTTDQGNGDEKISNNQDKSMKKTKNAPLTADSEGKIDDNSSPEAQGTKSKIQKKNTSVASNSSNTPTENSSLTSVPSEESVNEAQKLKTKAAARKKVKKDTPVVISEESNGNQSSKKAGANSKRAQVPKKNSEKDSKSSIPSLVSNSVSEELPADSQKSKTKTDARKKTKKESPVASSDEKPGSEISIKPPIKRRKDVKKNSEASKSPSTKSISTSISDAVITELPKIEVKSAPNKKSITNKKTLIAVPKGQDDNQILAKRPARRKTVETETQNNSSQPDPTVSTSNQQEILPSTGTSKSKTSTKKKESGNKLTTTPVSKSSLPKSKNNDLKSTLKSNADIVNELKPVLSETVAAKPKTRRPRSGNLKKVEGETQENPGTPLSPRISTETTAKVEEQGSIEDESETLDLSETVPTDDLEAETEAKVPENDQRGGKRKKVSLHECLTHEGNIYSPKKPKDNFIYLTKDLLGMLHDDYSFMNSENKLTRIPTIYSVREIMAAFCAEQMIITEKDNYDSFVEDRTKIFELNYYFAAGIPKFFDVFLRHRLLYESEVIQYNEYLESNGHAANNQENKENDQEFRASKVYGSIHLLRLLGHFDEFIRATLEFNNLYEPFREMVMELIDFLQDNKEKYFNYNEIYFDTKNNSIYEIPF